MLLTKNVTIVNNLRNTYKTRVMKIFLFLLVIGSTFNLVAMVDKIISKEEYVETWKVIAVQHMVDFKIPASITLAQGIIESGSGNSDLAKKGNNHFGIKCHEWTGEKMYMDDDAKGECFRVYSSADESFADHSKFLTSKSRYSKLFLFESTDYKSWAQGLKDAGYATNPKYPQMLIEVIENLKLYQLDGLNSVVSTNSPELLASEKTIEGSHSVYTHKNKVNYVVAKKGDTFYKIAKEFNLGLWQLYKYNDFGQRKDVLEVGDIIYLQPKRKHSKSKEDNYVLTETKTLRQVSQEEAIKLESLEKLNETVSPDEKIAKGQKVKLR